VAAAEEVNVAAEEKKVKSMGFTGQERVGHDGVINDQGVSGEDVRILE